MQISIAPMREIPIGIRHRLRELTIGPVAWGLWSLTYHDGSTWAAVAYESGTDPEHVIGWAALTEEYDALPMIGAYVSEAQRGRGIAPMLITTLLRSLLSQHVLSPGDTIVASTGRWDAYFDLAESCGLTCKTWE